MPDLHKAQGNAKSGKNLSWGKNKRKEKRIGGKRALKCPQTPQSFQFVQRVQFVQGVHRDSLNCGKECFLCALPLIRSQIESVLSLALFVREREKVYSKYSIGSAKHYYQRQVYLKRAYEGNADWDKHFSKILPQVRDWLTNKEKVSFINPSTNEELDEIEKQVNSNKYPKQSKFPGPSKVIKRDSIKNDPIHKVLLHLYAEYIWLSGFHHGNLIRGFSRRLVENNQNCNYIKHEISVRYLQLSFLQVLIALTDIKQVTKGNKMIEFTKLLSDCWLYTEDKFNLGSFAYEYWAKDVMGAIT